MNRLTRFFALGAIALMLTVTACRGIPTGSLAGTLLPVGSAEPATALTASSDAPDQVDPNDPQALGGVEGVAKRLGMMLGVVRAVNDKGIALRTPKGNEKVGVDATTVIVVPGKPNAKLSDIQTGDRVIVDARKKKDLADFVLVIPAAHTLDNLTMGMVQSNTNGTLTVRAPKDTRTVTTSSSTIVVTANQAAPALGTLADIKQGNLIVALGEKSDASLNAQVIVIVKNDLRGGHLPNPKPQSTPITPRQKPGVPAPTPNPGG